MNYSHLIHERSLTTTPHRQKPIIEPPDYPVIFLTQKNKSDRVQLVFFVVEMRDLPYSDCYRRSIACSRRGSHGNAVLRFFKIAINPRFDDIKKQVEQGSTCLLCGGDKGIRTPGLRIANATLYQLSHIPDSQIHLLCYYITLSAFGNNFLAICSAYFFAATLSASFHILIGCGVKYDMCFENKISATRNEY